jgi:hypothetical protein
MIWTVRNEIQNYSIIKPKAWYWVINSPNPQDVHYIMVYKMKKWSTHHNQTVKGQSIMLVFFFVIFSFLSNANYSHVTFHAASHSWNYLIKSRHNTANNFNKLMTVCTNVIGSNVHHLLTASDEIIHCSCHVCWIWKIKISNQSLVTGSYSHCLCL